MTQKINQDFFARSAVIVARELLGKRIIRELSPSKKVIGRIYEVAAYQGETDSTSDVIDYVPGTIGISRKFGKFLIDVSAGSGNQRACITLVSALFDDGLAQGPGNLSKMLQIDESFNGLPIVNNSLYLESDSFQVPEIRTRKKSNASENCKGFFYIRA